MSRLNTVGRKIEMRKSFSSGHRAFTKLDTEAIRHVMTGKRVTPAENPGIRLESRFINELAATDLVKELRAMDDEYGFTTEGHGLEVQARETPTGARYAKCILVVSTPANDSTV
jgi:hypothetical protein